jgi:L-aminopeptidase/D-esterase-like protein
VNTPTQDMISGFAVGHHTADGPGWLTGTTVISAPSGAVGGVDVRGGGPGTRGTDLLDPSALVQSVDAVVLTGGSAYGLAAADGVMQALAEVGRGFRVGPEAVHVVPIVPAAVIFDLGRGGDFGHRPTAEFGRQAFLAASSDPPVRGSVGAGTGAQCGGLRGGFGYAALPAGAAGPVAAAVVVNARGSAVDPRSGRLWSAPADGPAVTARLRDALEQARRQAQPSLATTIGVVLTPLTLTKAQARKVAAVAHDGLARAVRPVHSMTDGDTFFGLASAQRPEPDAAAFDDLLTAAADAVALACSDALLSASPSGVAAGPTARVVPTYRQVLGEV